MARASGGRRGSVGEAGGGAVAVPRIRGCEPENWSAVQELNGARWLRELDREQRTLGGSVLAKASRVPASDSPGGSGVQNTQLTIRSTSGSTNGQYWNGSAFTVAARTTDLAGNTGATTASSTTVDTAAPAVTIANPPTPSANTTPTLTGG